MATNLEIQSGQNGGTPVTISRLADAGAIPGTLTRSQRREIQRRQRALNRVAELKAAGLSEVKAAKTLRLSVVSLWRWRHRIVPATDRCGRKSALARFNVPERLISNVQKSVLAGCRHEKAWRALADDPACPNDLAEFLRQSPTIPASFFEASRLKRVRTTVLIGRNFTHVAQPLNA